MKKLIALLLSLALIFTLVACGKNKTDDVDGFVPPEGYTAILNLKINPEFDIYIDDTAKVLLARPLNDDAKPLRIP